LRGEGDEEYVQSKEDVSIKDIFMVNHKEHFRDADEIGTFADARGGEWLSGTIEDSLCLPIWDNGVVYSKATESPLKEIDNDALHYQSNQNRVFKRKLGTKRRDNFPLLPHLDWVCITARSLRQ
jgi:hypothetical protein